MTSRNKVSLLCRYGGNLVEESGKVSYKDGTNRMIRLGAQEINYSRLLSEVLEVCKSTNVDSIKYKHPELGLDCLVSVENDKDLWNMMQAFENQNNGPIQLYVSEAQQVLPIHNTIPSEDSAVLLEENRGEREEMPLQNNSNVDVNAMDNHDLHTSNHTEYGYEAQQTIPMHDTIIPSPIWIELAALLEENRGEREEMPLQNNSNMDVNAETTGMPTDLQVGVDEFGVDSHNLSISNTIEYGCANNTTMKLEEGQEFSNANDFDKFLREYAIRSKFEYKRSRSGHGRFAAKCIKKDCSWRIQASQISDSQPTFRIKSLKGNHICNMDQQFKVSHYQATRKWIADVVEHQNYFQSAPKVIAEAIEKEYGIHIGYHKAWRGRQLARERKNYVGKSSQPRARNYYNIEELCEDIRRRNPGARVNLQSKSKVNNNLKLFISYEAAVIPVFQMACKPVVELTAVEIGGKQPFVWFVAGGADTLDGGLLLACGFMEFDHEEHMQDGYKWFCSELFNILGGISNLAFVVEYRDEGGALEVVRAIFPHSHCIYSERSFTLGIRDKFDKLSYYRLCNAVRTLKQSEFEKCMSALYEECREAWEFLININPEYWATSHFKGACLDDGAPDFFDLEEQIAASGLAHGDRESDVSVVVLVEHLHNYMMERFTERVERSSGWTTFLLPAFQTHSPRPFTKVQILESPATTPTRFRVTCNVDDIFDIFGEEEKEKEEEEVVDMHMRNCSCGAWQIFGRPCKHAEEVINKFHLNRYEYWDECYMADWYRKAYSMALQVIHPLPRRLEKKEWVARILSVIFQEF